MRGQHGTPDPCLISLDTFSKLQKATERGLRAWNIGDPGVP